MSKESDDHGQSTDIERRMFIKSAGAAGTIGLAGCSSDGGTSPTGNGGTNDNGVTLEFYVNNIAAEKFPKQGLTKTLHESGLPENIDVKYVPMPAKNPMTSMQQRLSAGRSSPDIIQTDYGFGVSWIPQGYLLDLNKAGLSQDLIKQANNRYLSQHVDPMRFDNGNLGAIPLFLDIPTMQYRKDLAKEAGYDPEGEKWATKPMSWKRFSKITKDIQEQTRTKYGYTWQGLNTPQHMACCTLNEYLHSWGGSYHDGLENYFGKIGQRPSTVDEGPAVKAIRMMRTFIYGQADSDAIEGYKQITPKANLQWGVEPSRKPMANGNSVMHRNWPFAIPLNIEELGKENYGTMPIPYGIKESESKYDQLGGTISALGGWHMAINANSEKKEASIKFIEAAMSDAAQLHMFEIMGWQPAKPDLLESKRAKQAGVLGNYVDTFRVCADNNLISRPVTPVWTEEMSFYEKECANALKQTKSSQQAMTDLAERIEKYEDQAA